MEDERILEREREGYLNEQARQHDPEVLQVQEGDLQQHSSQPSHDSCDAASSGEFTFNTCIASLHTYLGEVEDTHHRTAFLDGGSILNLPLFCLKGVVLFPGATLPLRVTETNLTAAVERALSQADIPYTIGVIRVQRDAANHRMKLADIGTTAEIRQYGRLEDGSLNVVTRGQQRFRLRRCWSDVDGVPYGEIQIIEEDLPLRTPRDAFGKLTPLSNLPRGHVISQVFPSEYSHVEVHGSKNGRNDSEANPEESFQNEHLLMEISAMGSSYEHDMMDELASNSDDTSMHESDQETGSSISDSETLRSLLPDCGKKTEILDSRIGSCSTSSKQCSKVKELDRCCKNIDAYPSNRISRAFWPHWVYRMFDSYWLARTAADMWMQIVGAPSMDCLVKKPDLLSFHIASKIPVSDSTRQELLDIDGISYRLCREIELLQNMDLIRCKCCQTIIAKRSDMLVMSSEGPLGAYVNSGGFVHEIMTLYRANRLALIGPAVTEYSWFPGYAWTIAKCATCKTQMGWLFTATNVKLKPRSFWGIRSCQVAEQMR